MSAPRLLDLFSCAGGAGMGYHLAGFDVVGVDINPQPHYPFEHHVADALDFLAEHGHEYDAIHASPPCQDYSVTRSLHAAEYPRLVEPVRELLTSIGRPWVIENVVGAARDMVDPVRLCGSSFGLGVRRHRLFELSFSAMPPPACRHADQPEPIDVTGTGGPRRSAVRRAGGGNSRKPENLGHARTVMGIDWMTRRELSEAIPPAYTEWIGRQLLDHLDQEAAA